MMYKQEDTEVNEYLSRMKAGDISALAPLYDRTNRALYALYFTYFRNKPDSEDALSDTYLKIRTEIQKFNGHSGYSWMCTIARNICLNTMKKSNRVSYMDFDDEMTINTVGASENDELHSGDGDSIVSLAGKVLNEKEFRIVILHAISGIKFAGIAKLTGGIEATVRWQYNNAIKIIGRECERRGING